MKKLYFKKIVQSSDDAIISKNLDGIVTTWNASAENMFGYTSKEMIGSPILKLFHPEFLDEEKILLEQISIGQHVTHFETQRVCKDGSVINISVTLSPIFDEKKSLGYLKLSETSQNAKRWKHCYKV